MDYLSTAEFSEDARYRYYLTRTWQRFIPPIIFAMLNPSTATAEKDDPTIRRCIGYAKQWGYGGIIVINLFAIRSPNPKTLYTLEDPVGPENKDYWDKAVHQARATAIYEHEEGPNYQAPVICGWGTHGGYMNQDNTALGWLDQKPAQVQALGLTAKGFPKHPLYLKKDARRIAYEGRH